MDRALAVLRCAREGWLDEAVEIGDVEKPDPLRGFAREYLDAFDQHTPSQPDDEEAARCLAVSAEGSAWAAFTATARRATTSSTP